MNIQEYRDKLKLSIDAFVEYWYDMSEDHPSNYPYEMDEVDWDEQFFAYVNSDLDFNYDGLEEWHD
jgi:hypothetical protein